MLRCPNVGRLEGANEALVYLHDGGGIVEFAAVVPPHKCAKRFSHIDGNSRATTASSKPDTRPRAEERDHKRASYR